jgi:hypothetical protein
MQIVHAPGSGVVCSVPDLHWSGSPVPHWRYVSGPGRCEIGKYYTVTFSSFKGEIGEYYNVGNLSFTDS